MLNSVAILLCLLLFGVLHPLTVSPVVVARAFNPKLLTSIMCFCVVLCRPAGRQGAQEPGTSALPAEGQAVARQAGHAHGARHGDTEDAEGELLISAIFV